MMMKRAFGLPGKKQEISVQAAFKDLPNILDDVPSSVPREDYDVQSHCTSRTGRRSRAG